MGAGQADVGSLWINSLAWNRAGGSSRVEITAAPIEILHGAWAALHENRNWPLVVDPGEPSGIA